GIIEGKDGFLPFGGLDKQLAKYNESNAIYFKDGALIAKPADTIIIAPTKVASALSSNKTEGNQSQTVEQLKAWYFKASKQERKEFRKWMIDQE
ncbi:DUF2057 domain-containing protein, partial [Vibrio makurazakiensis]|uniref:DUF2057 family protein n=1 Tax=Vibrio makurazakiensis TaxID=2910250 RepID=UPI003D0D9877